MAGPTDFLRLYQELGLAPGASIDELRRAYRRRVSELHPDRLGQTYTATVPGAGERLQQITALYGAATQFHRKHGRLPGSAGPPHRQAMGTESTHTPPPPSTTPKRSPVIWLLGGIVLVVWLIWLPPWGSDDSMESDGVGATDHVAAEPVARARTTPVAPRPPELPRPAQVLKIGMEADVVLALQGEPVSRDEGRWDYGPSWIAFDQDKVTDWYSSTLRPLKFATRHPPPSRQQVEP
jgi:hypothetical protein